MGSSKEMLAGVFSPMCTPFIDEQVSLDGVATNIEKMNQTGLRGYFILGTNGEFKSLTAKESFEVLQTVVKHRSADKVVMAGTAAESTFETIEKTLKAADLGADLVSLLMPHFFAKKMEDDVLASFIIDVADASPIPVVLYNNPSVAAGVNIGADLIKRVAVHPNVIGIKDSSKSTYKNGLESEGDGFSVMAGSAGYFLDLLVSGGTGGVLSLANVFPDACATLYRTFKEGRLEEAQKLSDELISLNKEVSGAFGVAGVKAAMDLAGFVGGNPRKPLKGMLESQKLQLKETLTEKGFLK
ncbi:MAG: dihydrodipicolinate synthase family protein [SAR324 cluster bacterium]|nr:dihydrodipicolinate synthase family protein [SAR324 cluster bacterium]